MGRKPLGKKSRSLEIRIRLNPVELKELTAKAEAAGMPLGTWLRWLGMNAK